MFLEREGKPGESLFELLSRQKVLREGREGRKDRLRSNLLIPFGDFITFYPGFCIGITPTGLDGSPGW
jgi:hypothetical protein